MQRVDEEIRVKRNPAFGCGHCLPGCFALKFDSSFSMARLFDRLQFFLDRKLKSRNLAVLHIHYTQSMFRAQKKEELFGFTEFLCMFISSIFFHGN